MKSLTIEELKWQKRPDFLTDHVTDFQQQLNMKCEWVCDICSVASLVIMPEAVCVGNVFFGILIASCLEEASGMTPSGLLY